VGRAEPQPREARRDADRVVVAPHDAIDDPDREDRHQHDLRDQDEENRARRIAERPQLDRHHAHGQKDVQTDVAEAVEGGPRDRATDDVGGVRDHDPDEHRLSVSTSHYSYVK